MDTIRKINDELTIAGQVTPEQLQQIATEGFKSVINLRSREEQGFLNNEQQQAEALGLRYINIPVRFEAINTEVATKVLKQIDEFPKPALIHCDSAIRAAGLVLMHIAIRQGKTLTQALKQAEQLGLFGVLIQEEEKCLQSSCES